MARKPKTKTNTVAYKLGVAAYDAGTPRNGNPYSSRTNEYYEWEKGFFDRLDGVALLDEPESSEPEENDQQG